MTNYPAETFTSAFKAQAREVFPKAAIYAPLSTVDEIRTTAALSAVTITAQENETVPAQSGAAAVTEPATTP